MKLKRSLHSSDRGFSVLELLVASFLGLLVTGLCVMAALFTRQTLGRDMVRTRINQNLRGALSILLNDGRLAGENLGPEFPAIEIIDGGGNVPDELVLRRNLLDEVLPVCTTITGGGNTNKIYFAIAGNTAGCIYASHTQDYNAWKAYREAHDNKVKAFIFDRVNKVGEFFTYIGESDAGDSYYLRRDNGTWSRTYTVGAAAVYVLEEWRYSLSGDTAQVIDNRNIEQPYNVAFGLTNLQVKALMLDGTTKTSFDVQDEWTSLSRIEVTVTGMETFAKKPVLRSLTGRFFPRNILSN